MADAANMPPTSAPGSPRREGVGGTMWIFAAVFPLFTSSTWNRVWNETPSSSGLPVPSTMLLPRSAP